jgi:hypothetical protein
MQIPGQPEPGRHQGQNDGHGSHHRVTGYQRKPADCQADQPDRGGNQAEEGATVVDGFAGAAVDSMRTINGAASGVSQDHSQRDGLRANAIRMANNLLASGCGRSARRCAAAIPDTAASGIAFPKTIA